MNSLIDLTAIRNHFTPPQPVSAMDQMRRDDRLDRWLTRLLMAGAMLIPVGAAAFIVWRLTR